ncbi:MAG: branched-chain amino acid ABC transporter permease [Clostridia bacterium]|nr:MAG: branched-chain amino acid ABC transporter permease [Clostridia bacterium]
MLSAGVYSIAVLGMVIFMGYAGQPSLGHSAFMAIGAYTTAILTTRYGASPLAAMLIGILLCLLCGVFVGLPLLRLRGFYFAAGTLAFGLLVQGILVSWFGFTKGDSGIGGIPPFSFAGIDFGNRLSYYYLVWAVAVLLVLLSYNMLNSQVGRALIAIHGDEVAARSMGVNTGLWKMFAFLVSVAYAGISGSLLAHYLFFVSPSQFGVLLAAELIIMSLLAGGTGIHLVFWATILWRFLPELTALSGEWRSFFVGAAILVLLLVFPDGLQFLTSRRADYAPKPSSGAWVVEAREGEGKRAVE